MAQELPEGTTVKQFFEEHFEKGVNQNTEKLAGLDAVLQFSIAGEGDMGGEWYMTVKEESAKVETGKAEDAKVTFLMDGQDWLDMINGKLNGMTAFMTGKLKVQGDMNLAMKLGQILG